MTSATRKVIKRRVILKILVKKFARRIEALEKLFSRVFICSAIFQKNILQIFLCIGVLGAHASAHALVEKEASFRAYLDFDGREMGLFPTARLACETVAAAFNANSIEEKWQYLDAPGADNLPPYPSEGGGPCIAEEYLNGTLTGTTKLGWWRSERRCPANSIRDPWTDTCGCKVSYQANAKQTACVPAEINMCMAGGRTSNPILPGSAEKYRLEVDYLDNGPSPLSFSRIYRSAWGSDALRPEGVLGKAWTHSYTEGLVVPSTANADIVSVVKADGSVRQFLKASGASIWSGVNNADSLVQNSDGTWTYRRVDDDSTLSFSADGKLNSSAQRNGQTTTFLYNSSGQLVTISNGFGRTLTLHYDGVGKLIALAIPDSRTVSYSYDTLGRLSVVTYPDAKARTLVYENASFPYALTGIFDETGARFATFDYDSQGRAIRSELAGSADRYQVSYPSDGYASVIDPLGTSRSYSYSLGQSPVAVIASSLPSGLGESDAYRRVQDASGLITSETDFNNVETVTTWDVARRLPTTVVRGIRRTEAQTVNVQWHSTYSLPLLVTEDGRTTAYSYNSVGNVLSKTVTDTTTSKTQIWQWTYNAQQLVATATEPSGAVTSYTYDTQGNVLTSTNALGHVSSYAYDTANRVVSSTAPNGLVTTYTYDQRDRLLTQTVGGQTTVLTYKPYGTVETITLPSGLVVTYTYDAAHRLTGWSNNGGESGTYTLDGLGNRTAEQVKDSAGNLAWSAGRIINNINRVSAQSEGPNQTRSFGYDSNGDLSTLTNGLNDTVFRYGRDALRRVETISDSTWAFTKLQYNALDAVTTASDFKGVTTAYTRDAQGNATVEASADMGAASTQYDNLGLPSQITDALGHATTITRDILGRPTGLVFADGKTTTLRYDLTANSKGYLSEIVDRSGTTEYTRDAFGRVTLKKQTLANGGVQQVSYAYNPNGLLASIGYPNAGGILTYSYDSSGRVTGLSLNGNPLVTGIAWNPLGQPKAWSWAFSSPAIAANRDYDTAGRLTSTEFSSYSYDASGRITSLMQNRYQPADTDPTHSTIVNGNVTWSVDYDRVGRIASFKATGNAAADSAEFGYDANGNRSASTRASNGQTTNRTYTVSATSNQLTGFTQTINGASNTSVTYGYNANGDLLTDGLRSYTYDAEGRLAAATTGATDVSPTTRYAHNALGQRVFKTEPLYPPVQGDESNPGFMQSLIAFFTKLWSPANNQAEQLGYAYVYDEQGTLIAEVGSGGTNSAGQSQYIYLPTSNGPMPIAAIVNGATYAIHSDHLNTPRRLTNARGQAVWQWGYSAFGEDKPTTARNRFANTDTTPNLGTTSISEVTFNLRYPGQYADEESGLSYNYFRSYDARTGRYSQPDPIGLDGGWNRFGYVSANPLANVDPYGLADQLSVGISGTGMVLGGGGGGTSVGISIPKNKLNWKCYQAFLQFQANLYVGPGAFVGVGLSAGHSKSDGPITNSSSSGIATEGNIGWGVSGGGSATAPGNALKPADYMNPVAGHSGTIFPKIGAGFGVMVGAGQFWSSTLATSPWGDACGCE
ncbi:RHS repeat-associated core domain-containing protein [Variovorax sp. GB1R11]|uniref:RHS repeat-associated core domain-containing protein n=1 Tax=Variovorax sp. GB1R11 TaxID=3443741 RepID=UPI003F47DC44